MNCKEILNKCLDFKGNISPKKSKHLTFEEKSYLSMLFPFLNNVNIMLQHIKNDVYEQGFCVNCGKPTRWVKTHYQEYCCRLCMQQSNIAKENRKNTNLSRYGVITNLQTNEVVKKAKLSSHTKEALKKQQDTKKKLYGWETPFQNKESMELAVKNSHDAIANVKRATTNLTRYGCMHPKQSDVVKEKCKITCIDRYGVENPWQLEKVKMNSNSKEALAKAIETKRKNKSFNSSKPEEELHLYIKEKFPSVTRQYQDKDRYPWSCDFYIPELDLFLELNGTWTHRKHPYNSNSIKDQVVLEQWKSKKTKYYDNAIETWTVRDVKKRNKAKENNLNFKEVWSLEEGKKFIDSL